MVVYASGAGANVLTYGGWVPRLTAGRSSPDWWAPLRTRVLVFAFDLGGLDRREMEAYREIELWQTVGAG